jgi:protein TonB
MDWKHSGLGGMVLAALGSAALAQPSAPASEPQAAPPVTTPDWTRKATGDDVGRLYPRGAQARRVNGFATIRCEVTAEGGLSGCAVIREGPPGEGFGEAALKMAPLFKMRPQTKDGRPVGGGVVMIPIQFRFPGS